MDEKLVQMHKITHWLFYVDMNFRIDYFDLYTQTSTINLPEKNHGGSYWQTAF